MKTVKKAMLVSAAIIIKAVQAIIAVMIIFTVIVRIFEGPYQTQKKIEKEFYKNYDNISKITEYLIETKYSDISIYNTDYIYDDGEYGCWYVDNGDENNVRGKMPINNDEIVNDVSEMFNKREYQTITKKENAVTVQLWSTLDDGHGVAYSMDGNEPEIWYLTKLEKLDYENWYYYECNYNEWRKRLE